MWRICVLIRLLNVYDMIIPLVYTIRPSYEEDRERKGGHGVSPTG